MSIRAVNGNGGRSGRRAAKEVAKIFWQAFVHCLSATRTSQHAAARDMGVTRNTVQNYVSGKSDVNAKFVLRSARLWRPFWLCVGKLRHARNGSKRTLPHVLRARRDR